MPNNINKVVFGNDTLIDLTNDTVSADNLLEGETAHDRGGSPIVGTAKQGHSILNKLGILLTQRSKLKFGGMLRTTDDDTNGITVVSDEAEEIEWSVWSAMTEVEQNAYSAGKKIDILHAPSVQDNKVPKTDIATVESGSTASRAYSVGELVYVNGSLYKVITAISIGSTFTVGTNIQSTNVSDRVKEVNGLIKYDTVSGITDQNGNLATSVTLNARFILSAQFTMTGANGVAIPASYVAGNIWYFRCLDGLSQPMVSTTVTVKYAYVDI